MAKRRTKKNTSRRENNGIKVFALVMLIVLLLGIVAGAIVLGVRSDGFKIFRECLYFTRFRKICQLFNTTLRIPAQYAV